MAVRALAIFLAVVCLGVFSARADTPVPVLSATDMQQLAATAQAGDAKAQAHLGEAYATGTGVEQNYGYAYFLLTLANLHGDAEFEPIRAEIAKLMTPDTVAALDERAKLWQPGTAVIITQAGDTAPPPPPPVTTSDFSYFTQAKMWLKRMYFNATTSY